MKKLAIILAFILPFNLAIHASDPSALQRSENVAEALGCVAGTFAAIALLIFSVNVGLSWLKQRYSSPQALSQELSNTAMAAPDVNTGVNAVIKETDIIMANIYSVNDANGTGQAYANLRAGWQKDLNATYLETTIQITQVASSSGLGRFKLPGNYKSVMDYMIQNNINNYGLYADLCRQAQLNKGTLPDIYTPSMPSTGTGSDAIQQADQAYQMDYMNVEGQYSGETLAKILELYQGIQNNLAQLETDTGGAELPTDEEEAMSMYNAQLAALEDAYVKGGGNPDDLG